MKKKRLILNLISIILIGVMLYSGYKIFTILNGYRQAEIVKEEFQKYKPQQTETVVSEEDDEPVEEPVVNQSIIDAQTINPNIIGWVTVEGTKIDYPFVASKDNNDYLHTDLYGKYAVAGTIFMDYQCNPDFSDFNTILYGHKMKDGSMFGSISQFSNSEFWDGHPTGHIYLVDTTYTLNIFAYAVVDRYDEEIYVRQNGSSEAECAQVLEHIRDRSRMYRDISISPSDRIVILSTCNYEYDGARAILAAKITPEK